MGLGCAPAPVPDARRWAGRCRRVVAGAVTSGVMKFGEVCCSYIDVVTVVNFQKKDMIVRVSKLENL